MICVPAGGLRGRVQGGGDGKGEGGQGGGVGWGLPKEPASRCARVLSKLPFSNLPFSFSPNGLAPIQKVFSTKKEKSDQSGFLV